jgi:hypothetical protein
VYATAPAIGKLAIIPFLGDSITGSYDKPRRHYQPKWLVMSRSRAGTHLVSLPTFDSDTSRKYTPLMRGKYTKHAFGRAYARCSVTLSGSEGLETICWHGLSPGEEDWHAGARMTVPSH